MFRSTENSQPTKGSDNHALISSVLGRIRISPATFPSGVRKFTRASAESFLDQNPASGELTQRKFHRWLFPALCEWGCIVFLFYLGFFVNHAVFWLPIVILIGSRQHALGVLGHDAAHFAAARSKRLNDLSSELLCFWPLATGLHDFRRFHFEHHRYFNTPRDPELLFKNQWSRSQWALPSSFSRILLYFACDCLGFGVLEVAKAYYLLGKCRIRSWIGPATWWLLVGGSLYASGHTVAIIVWTLALVTSFWGFFRLRTWTEHVGSTSTHRVCANWWQRLLVTPHGSWSHYEHHSHPNVPYWQRHKLRGPNANTVTMYELFKSYRSRVDT